MTPRWILLVGVAAMMVLAVLNPFAGMLGCLASFFFGRMYQFDALDGGAKREGKDGKA